MLEQVLLKTSKKMITQHRALKYLIQEQIISCYGKLQDKEYQNADLITGETGWCDFCSKDEWGEISLVLPTNIHVSSLFKIFFINVEEFEEKYRTKINPNKILSTHQSESPSIFTINTESSIEDGLRKKLTKTYNFKNEGFIYKGTLILAILDPVFSGFDNDIEIFSKKLNLEDLNKLTKTISENSCFDKVLLVDGLSQFHENPQKCVRELLNQKEE